MIYKKHYKQIIGIAMGNAKEEVKKRADMVTSHIDEEGLYHALDRLGLLN